MKDKLLKYPDLIRYQRIGIVMPFVFTGIYEFILDGLIVLLFYNDMVINHFVFYMIIVLLEILPFILFKPLAFFTDKNYKGKVKKIEYMELISKGTQIPISYINGIGDLQDERSNEHMDCWQRITIKTANEKNIIYDAKPEVGKTHQDGGISVGSFAVKKHVVSSLLDYYNIGDEVEHYTGFPYNRKLYLKQNEKSICIVCGTLNLQKDDVCINCGHSIIK